MKFSHLFLRAIATVVLAAPLGMQAQVFTHDFTADSSGAPPTPFYNINNNSGVATWNVVNGQGLALTVGASGKLNEEFAQFAPSTPITLASTGDYITFTAVFNSSGFVGNTGGLLAGLYNTMGTPGTANLSSATVNTATSDDKGYFGLMGFNTSAGTSTKFYTRTPTAPTTTASELGYYSQMTAGTYAQLSSFAATGNANLANSTDYTLTYTVTKGATANTINAQILQGATVLDNWTTTDAGSTYSSFDELVIGFYDKNAASFSGTVKSVAITDYIQDIPEPSACVLAGVGMIGLALRRRVRR
jgi:PEP-CTERM motif